MLNAWRSSLPFEGGLGWVLIEVEKTKSTPSSPYGRGAAVFEAGAENYGCGEGAMLAGRKK